MNLRASFARLAGGRFWALPIAVALVILSAATYGVQNSPARYGAVTAGLALEMGAPEDLRLWQRSLSGLRFSGEGAKTEVYLAARQARGVAVVQTAVKVPESADGLRVELGIGAEGFEAGPESWQKAKLQILSFDRAGGFIWYWPRDIVVVSADRRFAPMTAVLPLREALGGVLVRIYNGADSGILRIGPVKIVPTMERPVFAFLRGGLILAWVAAGIWAVWAAARRAATRLRTGILFGVAALVLAGTLAPQPGFRTAFEPAESLVLAAADSLFRPRPSLPPPPRRAASPPTAAGGKAEADRPPRGTRGDLPRGTREDLPRGTREEPAAPRASAPAAPPPARVMAPPPDYPFSFKEGGHFSLFLLLGLACFAAFPRTPWYGRLLCLASFAVATESLQWFVVTRSSTVGDLVVDMAGLVLAAAATAAASWIMAAAKARGRDRASPGA